MALWLARHGETGWTVSGQHTGITDIALVREGDLQAVALGRLLAGRRFEHVFASPMRRAQDTARLAGFGDRFRVHEGLREVDYGEHEGVTTTQIRARNPDWELFRDGSPGGETPEQLAARVDALLLELRALEGDVLLFGWSLLPCDRRSLPRACDRVGDQPAAGRGDAIDPGRWPGRTIPGDLEPPSSRARDRGRRARRAHRGRGPVADLR